MIFEEHVFCGVELLYKTFTWDTLIIAGIYLHLLFKQLTIAFLLFLIYLISSLYT